MAYAALVSLKQTVQNILLHPHRFSIPCEKEHIQSFNEKLEFLQRFLEEYSPQTRHEKVISLEGRIGDAAYEAEDFMDLHLNNLSDSQDFPSFRIQVTNYIAHLVTAFKNDTYKLNPNEKERMGRINMKLIIKKFDSIVSDVTKIKEEMGPEIILGRRSSMEEEIGVGEFRKHKDFESHSALHTDSSKLVLGTTKNMMVGFDDHLIQIKDQLTGGSSALEVISILGMGGIGKTTLATHVYCDPSFLHQFDIRAWATVSQSYRVRDIMLSMLESMNKMTKEMLRERDDQLQLHVYKTLKDRRYLIIIDDIWDADAWDGLKMMFPDDKTGSRIMLTTRIADVAAYASPSGTLHQISLLSEDQSWKLLCAKVFGDKPCPHNLQEIGKTIALNCRGLPLSIVVIGGLLSKVEKTQKVWHRIAENVTSFVFSSDDQCSDILRLSYNYLPQYLKACFLYMAVFPKSYEIDVSNLTKMWVAEGFLRQADGQCPEEVAERCVEDLIDRSLILMSKKNYEGDITAFRIHDLLLDFCIKEAKDEKFLQITEGRGYLFPSSLASYRRISIHSVKVSKPSWFASDSMSSTSYVRSLVCVGRGNLQSSVFLRFKLLKVLDASQVEFLEFPSQVLELLNLRYIALICDGDVPASIANLWNLQTLIIVPKSHRRSGNYLPVEIWNMERLRHIRCDGANLLLDLDKNCLVLKDLQTLSGFRNLIFSKELLHSIPNIKKIDVLYQTDFLGEKELARYQLENIGSLHQLKTLELRVIPQVVLDLSSVSMIHFPPSLRSLTLGGVGIPWNDLAIIGSLPNLEVLKLINDACLGTEWEPNEDEFCKLKVLALEHLSLKHWRADSNHFPSLHRLVIRWCYALEEIPSGMGESAALTMIELVGCNDSVLASADDILEQQLSYGNDDFQVISSDPVWSSTKRQHILNKILRKNRQAMKGQKIRIRKKQQFMKGPITHGWKKEEAIGGPMIHDWY